ncbi:MAG: phage protease [Polyangiales bacterium]
MRRVSLSAPLPASPPTEFRIWPFGAIETTKGRFLFDDRAAKAVVDAWKTYGNRLTIDYEHKAVDPDARAGDGKSAGSFELELRGDGLWAVDVRWTPPAFDALTNKEWLYFSPYFSAEEESGRILELINLALTNIPATRQMTPLVAAHRSALKMENDDETTTSTSLDGEDDAPPPSSRPDDDKVAARKAAKDRMAKLRAALAEAEKEWTSLASDEEGAGASSEEDETLDETEEPEDKPTPTATSHTAASRAVEASRIAAAAAAATGKTDAGEIVGALTALSKTRATNVSLSKRLAQLERKLQKTEVEALVTRAIKTGRLTPAEREWALDYGMESIAKLRGYLDVTPKRAVMAGSEPREPRGAGNTNNNGGGMVTLSDTERRICANTGISPEKFVEIKNRPIRYQEG